MIRRYWIVLFLSVAFLLPMDSIAQKPIKRERKEKPEQVDNTNRRKAEAERKRKAEEQRKREAEERRQREAEAQRQREAEERRQREAEERRQREAAERKRREDEERRKASINKINGHEYVDLGLPSGLKWATCNVGATSASGYGDYFAWGETRTKSSYTDDNSLTFGKSVSELRSAGIIGSDGNLTRSYDAARANWGGSWRMPTKAECEELVDRCKWTWTTQGGHNGYKVTGPNGKSIFLPAAGYRYGTSLNLVGELGYYWSSSPYGAHANLSYNFCFYSSSHGVDWYYRNDGQSVRPVSE